MAHDSLKKTGLNPLEPFSFDADDESENGYNVIVDKFDERDEDVENARKNTDSSGSADGRGSPPTSDSATVSQYQRNPAVTQRTSERPSTAENDDIADDVGNDAPYLPYPILSPDPHNLESGEGPVGRKFP